MLCKGRQLTVHLDEERLDHIVSDHFKVGMTNPVRDGSSGPSEKVVEDSNFMAKEHEPVDQVRSDESRSSSHCSTSVPLSTLTPDPPRILLRSELGNDLTGGKLAMVVYLTVLLSLS